MTKGPVLRWCCTQVPADGKPCPHLDGGWPDAKRSIGLSIEDTGQDRDYVERELSRYLERSEFHTDQYGVRHHMNINGVRFLIHRVEHLTWIGWHLRYAGHVDPDTWIEIQPRYEENEQAAEAVSDGI